MEKNETRNDTFTHSLGTLKPSCGADTKKKLMFVNSTKKQVPDTIKSASEFSKTTAASRLLKLTFLEIVI